jgi:hypothetical protein
LALESLVSFCLLDAVGWAKLFTFFEFETQGTVLLFGVAEALLSL